MTDGTAVRAGASRPRPESLEVHPARRMSSQQWLGDGWAQPGCRVCPPRLRTAVGSPSQMWLACIPGAPPHGLGNNGDTRGWAWGSQSLADLLKTGQESRCGHGIHAQRNRRPSERQKPFLSPPPPGLEYVIVSKLKMSQGEANGWSLRRCVSILRLD